VGEHVSTRNGTEERCVIRVLYVLRKGTGYGLWKVKGGKIIEAEGGRKE
jgi:hypothetical protein